MMENRKVSKADKTRQFIVEKTAPVFNKKGYAGTSLTDIVEATGLTKGSIYGNFKNKDEVAIAAFEHNLKQVNKVVADEMGKRSSYREKLLAYTHAYGSFLEFPFPEGGCPVLNTAVEADDTHPELKEKAKAAVLAWKDTMATLVRKGIAENEFRNNLDPEQVALTLIATIEGAVMITKVTGRLDFRRAIMASIDEMVDRLS